MGLMDVDKRTNMGNATNKMHNEENGFICMKAYMTETYNGWEFVFRGRWFTQLEVRRLAEMIMREICQMSQVRCFT